MRSRRSKALRIQSTRQRTITLPRPKLIAAQKAVVDAREIEVQKQSDADAARDLTVAAEWAFHNLVLGAKDQVKAQYGDNSDQYAGLGLTKKSERQSPSRPAAATSAPPGNA